MREKYIDRERERKREREGGERRREGEGESALETIRRMDGDQEDWNRYQPTCFFFSRVGIMMAERKYLHRINHD